MQKTVVFLSSVVGRNNKHTNMNIGAWDRDWDGVGKEGMPTIMCDI
jgi:hypothetical protein